MAMGALLLVVGLGAFLLAVKVYQWVAPMRRAKAILNAQDIPIPRPSKKAASQSATEWKPEKRLTFMRQAFHRFGIKTAAKYGGVIRIPIGPWDLIQVSDPFVMAEIWDRAKYPQLVDKPRGFPFLVYSALDTITTPASPNMLTGETADPHWKLVRKQLAPAFSIAAVKREAFPVISNMGSRLLTMLKKQGSSTPLDMSWALQCYALDVIGKFAFDRDFEASSDMTGEGAYMALCIRETANFIVECAKTCLLGPIRPYVIPEYKKKQEQKEFMEAHLRGLMKEVLLRDDPTPDDNSVAATLLRNKKILGPTRLFAEVSIMFLAGMETTGNTMSWALWNISCRPEVEAGVAAELDSLGLLKTPERPNPRDVTYDDLNKLPYLTSCIKESQRVLPTAPMLFRQAQADMQLGPYQIPKGTTFVLHLMAMHLSEDNYENASQFIPERWMEPGADLARKPGQQPEEGSQVRRFLPFGDGPRKCIGGELARVSYMTTLARMFANFRFRLAEEMGGPEGVLANESWAATLHSRNGLVMHAVPRC